MCIGYSQLNRSYRNRWLFENKSPFVALNCKWSQSPKSSISFFHMGILSSPNNKPCYVGSMDLASSFTTFWINISPCVGHYGTKMGLLAMRIVSMVAVTLCHALTSASLLPQVTLCSRLWVLSWSCLCAQGLSENSAKRVQPRFSILLPELHPLAVVGSALKLGTNLQFFLTSREDNSSVNQA